MSPAADEEREVDLARWRRAVVALWWLPVAGLVAGGILGILYSFSGGTSYKATALISLGQPTSPGGALVTGFGSNPRAISLIVSSADAQERAANSAGMSPGALRDHVSVAQVGVVTGAGSAAGRSSTLISLTVTGSHPIPTAAAANALAQIVVGQTTASYVGVKIRTFQSILHNVNVQLQSVKKRLAVIQRSQSSAKNLDPLQQLVIVSQEDNAETRLGNLIGQQDSLQQQLAFSKEIESAKVVVAARPVKASAHSRNISLLVGALIGLILGAVAAIVVDARASGRPA